MEFAAPIMLDRPFLTKILISNLQIFVQNLSSLTVLMFQICRFQYLLHMESATSAFAELYFCSKYLYLNKSYLKKMLKFSSYADFSIYFIWKVPCPLMIVRPFLSNRNHIEPRDIRTKFVKFNCSGVLDMQIL